MYLCQCDCGKLTRQRTDHMRSGRSQSCGCFRNEETSRRSRKHGKSGTSIYWRYQHMLERCYDPTCPEYKWYGGSGVTVCDRWNPAKGGSFENFLADMGEPPEPGLHLDKDIAGGKVYSPQSCRWVTPAENQRAKSSTVNLTFNGKTQCLTDWAREMGIKQVTLSWRLSRGWSVEKALTTRSRLGGLEVK